MRYREIVEGIADPLLYHWTNLHALRRILAQNALLARTEHDIPLFGKMTGISTSRNPNFYPAHGVLSPDTEWRLVLDRNAVRARNRIVPVDGEKIFRVKAQQHYGSASDPKDALEPYFQKGGPRRYEVGWGDRGRHRGGMKATWLMSEEFVIGNLTPLSKFLVSIDSFARHRDEEVQRYADNHDIPVRYHTGQTKLRRIGDTVSLTGPLDHPLQQRRS